MVKWANMQKGMWPDRKKGKQKKQQAAKHNSWIGNDPVLCFLRSAADGELALFSADQQTSLFNCWSPGQSALI